MTQGITADGGEYLRFDSGTTEELVRFTCSAGTIPPVLHAIEAARVATAVRDSVVLLAALSGLHLVGMTIIVGTAIVIALQLISRAFSGVSHAAVLVPASRMLLAGLSLSLVSGLLMVMPRASASVANPTFQLKMLALVAAVTLHVVVVRPLSSRDSSSTRLAGAAHVLLWMSVAVLGAMFTLLE